MLRKKAMATRIMSHMAKTESVMSHGAEIKTIEIEITVEMVVTITISANNTAVVKAAKVTIGAKTEAGTEATNGMMVFQMKRATKLTSISKIETRGTIDRTEAGTTVTKTASTTKSLINQSSTQTQTIDYTTAMTPAFS
jgi:hypothetical protein